MNKIVISTVLAALIIGLSGCSTPPEPPPDIPLSLLEEFQKTSANIVESGGLAAVGIARSKSLYIALNKAQADGRIQLADRLELQIEALQKDVPEETTQAIIANHIQDLIAKELKHEVIDGVISAYALMELDPQVLDKEGLQ